MGYGVFKVDGQWPPNAPADGERVGYHYRASEDECEGGEVYIEDEAIFEPLGEPRWDATEGKPRPCTDEELAEEERQATLERVAGQAEASLGSQFVNPNDVLGRSLPQPSGGYARTYPSRRKWSKH